MGLIKEETAANCTVLEPQVQNLDRFFIFRIEKLQLRMYLQFL